LHALRFNETLPRYVVRGWRDNVGTTFGRGASANVGRAKNEKPRIILILEQSSYYFVHALCRSDICGCELWAAWR